MPLEGEKLVLSPRYPNAATFPVGGEPDEPLPENVKVRGKFYSHANRIDVVIYEESDGKITWGWLPAFHHLLFDLHTMGCSYAWGLEQEHRALLLLGEHVTHTQLKQYLLTGMFMETSKRSGIRYIFRKLRPTIALSSRDDENMRILCTLCLHPLGYYEGSWAGAMCPTDDVIAHLMLMRADEHMFWKSSNQHSPHRPEAGL